MLKVKESQIQTAFFNWVRIQEKHDWRFRLIFAVPNGGQRHPAVAAKLKREGVRAGVPDVLILAPGHYAGREYPGAVIEFKAGRNKLTEDQDATIRTLDKAGYLVSLMRSTDSAIQFVETYFQLEQSKQAIGQ